MGEEDSHDVPKFNLNVFQENSRTTCGREGGLRRYRFVVDIDTLAINLRGLCSGLV